MAKNGFNNQWIAISQVGTFRDSAGVERDLNDEFIGNVIANFAPHDAPAVVGHPKDNAPAFGWASAIRVRDGVLEAQFADTDDEFERMVEQGKFRKRSASFYLNPPSLRHVGFLGAMPPAVKGLRDIQFADGESVTVEIISFREENMGLEDKDVEKVTDGVFEKIKGFFKQPEAEPEEKNKAEFSEENLKAMVASAVEAAKTDITADFTEKLNAKDTVIESLRDAVDKGVNNSKRAEIASFVESIPAEKGKHFLKRAGIADFMEALAKADDADTDAAISFSEGDTEYKFSRLGWFKDYVKAQQSFVSFGENFGAMTVSADAEIAVNPDDVDAIRGGMGMPKKGGKK